MMGQSLEIVAGVAYRLAWTLPGEADRRRELSMPSSRDGRGEALRWSRS